MAKLTFVIDDGQVVVPLTGLITFGRDDDNDVVIDDERISRHHAELLTHADGRIEVHDLGSTAGTFVNDRPVRNHTISKGDTLAFGPIAARIDLDDSAGSPAAESAREEEKRLAELQASIQDLVRQHDEKSSAVQKLDSIRSAAQKEIESLAAQQKQEQSRLDQIQKDCDKEDQRLDDLRRQLAEAEERSRASKTLAETQEARTRESLNRIQTELTARENDLANETRRIDEARAQHAKIEEQCQELATTEQKLAEQNLALQKAASEQAAAQASLADLSGQEEQLRAKLDALGSETETARNDLASIQSQLIPLRDWKKSMDQRYARLAGLPKDSAAESDLWREIEDAQTALFDLLPATGIKTPGLARSDFVRISAKAGIPMKSDRIRRSGT